MNGADCISSMSSQLVADCIDKALGGPKSLTKQVFALGIDIEGNDFSKYFISERFPLLIGICQYKLMELPFCDVDIIGAINSPSGYADSTQAEND